MKQALKISHFIGRSENAVRLQIAAALIAFLLLRIMHKMAQGKHGRLELTLLVRPNLMHRKDFTRLRPTQFSPPRDQRQLSTQLELNLNRTAVARRRGLMVWTAPPRRHQSAKAWSQERHKEGDRP